MYSIPGGGGDMPKLSLKPKKSKAKSKKISKKSSTGVALQSLKKTLNRLSVTSKHSNKSSNSASSIPAAVTPGKKSRRSIQSISESIRSSVASLRKSTATVKGKSHSAQFVSTFHEFHLCIRGFPQGDVAGVALDIFYELDFLKDFMIKRQVITRFVDKVEKGYRRNSYHNWHHAVCVAHCAFLFIKKMKLVETQVLTKLEAFALVVSALVHDIDHRGTNNVFQSYTQSDVYLLYGGDEPSIMERHHIEVALSILTTPSFNILTALDETEYDYFIELLKWNVYATDLSKHLRTREQLFVDVKSGRSKDKRMALCSLLMTAADLSDNCKKWDDNLPTVKGLLQEFFAQGDKEIKLGLTPMTMMNRNEAYIPLIEYKFTKYVVAPVYTFLSTNFEGLAKCVANISNNENLWTLSTVVFDKVRAKPVDKLDILDLPEMKEEALKMLKMGETVDEVKKRRFSTPIVLLDEVDLEKVDISGKRKFKYWFKCSCFFKKK